MKLINENLYSEIILESAIVDNALLLEGPVVMCNAKNRNGRNYDLELVGKPAVAAYNKNFVAEGRAIGELEHPDYPMPKIKEAAVILNDPLIWQGTNAHGTLRVLNNQYGQQLRSLHEAGYKLGVSTRGLGDVDKRTGNVKPGYMITAPDIVDRPSGQVCYMNAVNESVEWVEKNGVWVPTGVDGNKADAFIKENFDNMDLVARFKAVLNHL